MTGPMLLLVDGRGRSRSLAAAAAVRRKGMVDSHSSIGFMMLCVVLVLCACVWSTYFKYVLTYM